MKRQGSLRVRGLMGSPEVARCEEECCPKPSAKPRRVARVTEIRKLVLLFALSLYMSSLLYSWFTDEPLPSWSRKDFAAPPSPVRLVPDGCPGLNSTSSRFDEIYDRGLWGVRLQKVERYYGNAEWPPRFRFSASGLGSYLGFMTRNGMRLLRETVRKYDVKTMIDLPCGDTNWIFDSWEIDSLEMYIGLDIVMPVIQLNSMRLHHHSNKVFRHWDGTRCPLPKLQMSPDAPLQPVDLVHSRDVLQHLGLEKSLKFVCQVVKSGARLFVTTTFPGGRNIDIKDGRNYQNDMTKPPFDFPTSTSCVRSHGGLMGWIEPDITCVYNLKEPWVEDWLAKKCT